MSSLPNVVAVATATNYGRFAVGPLEPGIGITLGNALRRILLSSLPGSAVTSDRHGISAYEYEASKYHCRRSDGLNVGEVFNLLVDADGPSPS